MNIYGIVTSRGEHIDVSKSERGAKQYATRNGYNKISVRFNCGYDVQIIAERGANGKWKGVQ